jgi:hypothetical protein
MNRFFGMATYVLVLGAISACRGSVETLIEDQEKARVQRRAESRMREQARQAAEQQKDRDAEHRARDALQRSVGARAEARTRPFAASRGKLREAQAHAEDGLADAPKGSKLEQQLTTLRDAVLRELEVAEVMAGRDGSEQAPCALTSSGIDKARCERQTAELLLEYSRKAQDDDEAKALLDRAGRIAVSAARHAAELPFNAASFAEGEKAKAKAVLGEIGLELAGIEARFYTRSSTTVAIIEVSGRTSSARIDLGRSSDPNPWCAALDLREKLVAAGIPADRVVVSARPLSRNDGLRDGEVEFNVRPALREEEILNPSAACRENDKRADKWMNPFVVGREEAALVSSAPALIAGARSAIQQRRFDEASEVIESLTRVVADVPEAAILARELDVACEREAQRLTQASMIGPASASFAALAKCTRPMASLLTEFEAAGQSCACSDEFEARDCAKRKASAATGLERRTFVLAELSSGDLELGTYDFSAKRFPIAVRAPMVEKTYSENCDLRVPTECDGNLYYGTPTRDQNLIKVTASSDQALWRGFMPVAELDAARLMKADFGRVQGQAILVIRSLKMQSAADEDIVAAKKETLAEIARARARRTNATPEQKKRIDAAERCVRATKSRFSIVRAEAVLVGLRLGIPRERGYLLEWPEREQ